MPREMWGRVFPMEKLQEKKPKLAGRARKS